MAQLKSAAEAHNEQTPGTVQLFTHKMSIPESHLYCSGIFILCAPSADGEGAHIAHTTPVSAHCGPASIYTESPGRGRWGNWGLQHLYVRAGRRRLKLEEYFSR